MGRDLCIKCGRSFATVGKPCRLHRDITVGQTAALGRYLNPSEQESPKEYGTSSGSNNPLLPNDEHIAEPYMHDIKRSVADDQKCDRQPEYSSPSTYLESSINVNKLGDSAEKSSSKLIPAQKRESSCQSHYKSDDVLKKATFDQKTYSSVKSRRKLFKKKIPEKKLQECGKGKLTGSISNQSECSLPKTNLESSTHVTTLEDSDNPSKLSKGESITSSFDSFATPGPSGVTKKTNTSNISDKTLQSKSSLKDQSDGAEDKSKSTCKKCKREICDHAYEIEGRYLFKCCACNYRNENKNNLRMHAYYNSCLTIDRSACYICDELIWDKVRHDNEATCEFCGEKFRCMTQLENHALDHEPFFKKFCRVCKNKISEHINPQEKKHYKCCKSDYNGRHYYLLTHLYKHKDLQLFKCDLCYKRYQQQRPLNKHLQLHFKCQKCPKTFVSENLLDEHDKEYHN